jgi:hypothetical protein
LDESYSSLNAWPESISHCESFPAEFAVRFQHSLSAEKLLCVITTYASIRPTTQNDFLGHFLLNIWAQGPSILLSMGALQYSVGKSKSRNRHFRMNFGSKTCLSHFGKVTQSSSVKWR